MKLLRSQPFVLVSLWLVLVIISLSSRSYIPIDETRYVTVAWNMWLRGDYLVPWLNGAAYSHKPPLLFWLMNAGWAVFGVSDWWPRLVPSLFALASVFLTIRLSRKLYPFSEESAAIAPVILLGCALWSVFTTATMFDMLVVFFTMLGMLGVLTAWQGKAMHGWVLFVLAVGGGLLAKGPTILLQTLPVALLAPWWGASRPQRWLRWYACIFAAVVAGVVVALLWAVPAGMRGGEEYRHAIFWGQTADRVVHSFAHRREWWWYLPLLPVMFFPWLLWLPLWRGGWRLRLHADAVGVRFCIAWIVPVFVAFCAISGKQMHYLLPVFPAFAVLAAFALDKTESRPRDMWLLSLAAIGIGAYLVYLPQTSPENWAAPWIGSIPVWPGTLMMLSGASLLWLTGRQRMVQVWGLTLFGSLTVVLVVYVALLQSAGLSYDVRPLARYLSGLQQAGIPILHVSNYHGQYQFLGRLQQEIDMRHSRQVSAWFEQYPNGKAIVYPSSRQSLNGVAVDYRQPYRGDWVIVIGKDAWPLKARDSQDSDAE